MKIMLDTNVCIAIIKHKPPKVFRRFRRYKVGDIGISSVTLAELEYGVAKSLYQEKNREALEEFISPLEIADFGEAEARVYGVVRAALEKRGTPIGALDTMIAAHALTLGAMLVTNNRREFSRIETLKMADWISG